MIGGWRVWAATAAGSALGSVARYLVSLVVLAAVGQTLPWGLLLVNAAGSFLIGAWGTAAGTAGPVTRAFVAAGFCGGFTTFSIFSLEVVLLAQEGAWAAAAGFVGVSVLLWLGGAALGAEAGQWWRAATGGGAAR